MGSKYFIGSRYGDPTRASELRDEVDSAFQLLEADFLRSVQLVDLSGSGPATGADIDLDFAVTSVIGAFVRDASGAAVLLWRPGSNFDLSADGLTITNEAADYNAAGDTFLLVLGPKRTEPT